jgi:mannose-6-phosphate isomerase-like protein (cupin superfamily)
VSIVIKFFAMASALELSLDELFASDGRVGSEREGSPTHLEGVSVGRSGRRTQQSSGTGISWESLTGDGHALRLGILSIDAGASTIGQEQPSGHSGTEWGYVMSGTLDLKVDGRAHVLRSGDSFELDATHPHSLSNAGPSQTHLFWIGLHMPGNRESNGPGESDDGS